MHNYPWIKDRKSAMITVSLMGLLAGVGMTHGAVAGLCALALPLLGAMNGPVAGLITVFLGMALPQVSLSALAVPFEFQVCCAGYGFLIGGAALWAFSGKKPFVKALAIQCGATALGICLIIMGLRAVVGANLFTGIARWAVKAINGMPGGDQFLAQAAQSGLASAPGDMMLPSSLVMGMKPLVTPALRHELSASLQTTFELELYAQLPAAVVALIIGGSLLVLCRPICVLKKRGLEPMLQMPAFEKWHLPRGFGGWTAALLAGYVIQLTAGSYWELYWGGMLAAAFQWIYMIQGAAYWEYGHKRMGGTVRSRRAFVILTGLFIPFLLVVFGVLDQRADKRGLREKIEED